MTKLHFYKVTNVDELAWPKESKELSLGSSALEFLTDFTEVEPLVIEATVSAVDVKRLMLKAHVRMKVVVDENNHLLGVISSEDFSESDIIHKVSEGYDREAIPVTEFMTHKKDLKALDYDEVSESTIGDVIEALKDSGDQHCLVVDRGAHLVRGIFSASDISRKLHLPIYIHDKPSFYKVFSVAS